ncbi:methionine ABC transporter permease [Pseudoscardovia radai]|uniref:methionine ABC transporter permease n=1 Tax=Pseudoscardovia radai TaxID=987066 RepID=UPI0039917B53
MTTWDIIQAHLPEALLETLYMVVVATVVGIVLGGLLGVLLYVTESRLLHANRAVNAIVGFIVNAIRSLPFLILLVVLIPVVTFFVGDPYTPTGGAIALCVAAIPFFARISESAFAQVDPGIVEASVSTGATVPQILWGAVFPQARPSLVRGIVITIISLIGSSAMVGTIGAGGIGDMAIQYGYNRYETGVLAVIVVILIAIVQVIQWIGNRRAKALTH